MDARSLTTMVSNLVL